MKSAELFSTLTVRTRKEFILKKKDEPLAKFSLYYARIGPAECVIDEVYSHDSGKLPYGLVLTNESLAEWLQSRFIPKNRMYVEKLLSSLNTDKDDLASLLTITLGLSLTDDYWVVQPDSGMLWSDHNLYENEFSETLAAVAFTGNPAKVTGLASSPEYTTNGMLPKCWRRIGGEVYLFKGGTTGAANAGLEPYSEFYAAQVAEVLDIPHARYDLTVWKGILCSVCKLFTSEHRSLVPAHLYFGKNIAESLLRAYDDDPRLYSGLVDILMLDWVIANQDRHLGNFGFLRDNDSGDIIGIAPVFDHGMSLLHQAMEDDLEDLESYLSWRAFTFLKLSHEDVDVMKSFLQEQHREKLKKLLDFQFRPHEKYNLPDKRLAFLSSFVRERASQLLR